MKLSLILMAAAATSQAAPVLTLDAALKDALERNRIYRVSDSAFDDGDDFCIVWHFLDLLPGGPAGWHLKSNYD